MWHVPLFKAKSRFLLSASIAVSILDPGLALAQAPTVTTGSTSAVTSIGATLNGSINPNGAATTASFDFGGSWQWGEPLRGPRVAHSGTKVWARGLTSDYYHNEDGYITSPSIDLSSLAGQTPVLSWWQWLSSEPLHDRGSVEVSRDGGALWTPVYEGSGDADLVWTRHEVTLDSTYAVSAFRVRFRFLSDFGFALAGYHIDDVAVSTVESPGSTTYAQDFEASAGGFALTIASYGRTVPVTSPGSGTSAVSVSGPISGLTCETVYHYRATATNAGGTTNGLDATLTTTVCAPTATTGDGTGITLTAATLNGTTNPNGGATTAVFEYGLTTLYGSTTPVQNLGSGRSELSLSGAAIAGLTCGTTYHFRVVATNVGGITNGADRPFTTTVCPPVVTTGAASGMTVAGATLNGTINPNGGTTNAFFDFGGSWQWGVPQSGPGVAHSGTKVWGRGLNANYGNDEDGYITSPNIDLSSLAGQTPVLSWWQWLKTELLHDHGSVEVSKDGGALWTAVYEGSGDADLAWARREVTLDSTYAVSTFRVRFRFRADFEEVFPGYHIDDVAISTVQSPGSTAYTQDFEASDGGFAVTMALYGRTVPLVSPGSGILAVPVSGEASPLTCNGQYRFRLRATNVGGTTIGLESVFTTTACPPLVTTGVASNITANGATLNGTVNPNTVSATAVFEYGTTVLYGSTTTAEVLAAGTTAVSLIGGAITGLTCETTYHFRAAATNVGGTTNGLNATFTTGLCPPTVATGAATGISLTGATLNGTVNPRGTPATAWFEFGPTTLYGSATTSQSLGSGISAIALPGGAITGLTCGTTYHFRTVATNLGGVTNGLDAVFTTTACPPTVITGAASSITATGATLNGTVNPNVASTTAMFQYGTTAAYGSSTISQSLGSGASAVSLGGGAITGLTCETTYHFRVVATNIGGTTNGLDATFTTATCPPTATTGVPTGISLTGATLNGTVNPSGTSTTALFQYGTTTSYGSSTISQSLGSGTSAIALPGGAITGLTCGTTYHFRVVATNLGGTTNGLNATFATTACPPTVTTGATSGISLTGATLTGTVNPNNASTTAMFEYGTTTSYGSATTSQSLGSGTSAIALPGGAITGLTCGTTYHFRVVATNVGGTTNSPDATFATTACAPTVTTGVPSGITLTGATLSGTVNPNNASTTAFFEYGTTTSYGSATTSQNLGSGTSAVTLPGGGIAGLTCGTTYHFRVVATNVGGTTNGANATFITTACAPTVAAGAPTGISLTGATLNGTVNPNNASTTASFEYGTTTSYGNATTPQSLGSGTSAIALPGGAITGLTCGTTYHFRVVATNIGGTTNGLDAIFATTACPPTVTTGVAGSISPTGATLNGIVNPNNASTTALFEYGPTASYGSATTSQTLGSGISAIALGGGAITGLACGTTYHFRVTATNVGGTTNGLDAMFTTTSCPPSVTTGVASGISLTGATLNGTVNPNGASTTASFEYGTTTSYGSGTPPQSLGSGISTVALGGGAITGLTCGTTYHFRVTATNVGGTTNSPDATFATTACPPTVTTGVASGITPTAATLGGTVNPNGASTAALFEYGTTTSYGQTVPLLSPGSGTSAASVSGLASGLTCDTTYHFRLVATNVGGTTNGPDATFVTTRCPPTVTTGVASSISLTGATLSGTANPNGASTTASFEYGTTTSYGSATTPQSLGSGTSAVSLSGGVITGLTCGTTYHFRVVATNVGGTTNGANATFITTACAPTVTTGVASGISLTGATLNGTVNPRAASTTALFEYGTTTSYGSATTPENLGSGTSAVAMSGAAITGLTCGTTYHFRVVATNVGGTTNGLDATFATTACPPTVTTGGAIGISLTGATLSGTVNPRGASTTALFEYGTTTSYGSATTLESLGSGTSAVSLSGGAITGLTCGTTYHFRVTATNVGGTTNGLNATFTTTACAPTVTTGVASGISLTGVTLNGTVNPRGASTTASFEYGTTTSYGSATTPQSLGSGTSAIALPGGAITGLTCGTTYHFRAVATNVGGTTNGSDVTFETTGCAPTVTTGVASSITATGATLNGTVNPKGASTTAMFEYGTTTSYGQTVPLLSPGSGTSAESVSGPASGLTCDTTYHFRVVATNVGGTTNGSDATFATTACPPAVTTGVASGISLTGATLNGTVNPNGASTTASFEYGTTTSYGSSTATQSLSSGTSAVSLSGAAITGLTCGTTYHFRTVATNVGGTTNGLDATFATTTCPTTLSVGDAVASEGYVSPGVMKFLVSLPTPATGSESVDYATSNGTATEPSDYVFASGQLTFAPGERRKFIEVTINGDKVEETNETFTLTLSNPAGFTLARTVATGTILNDDEATLRVTDAKSWDQTGAKFGEGTGTGTSFLSFNIWTSKVLYDRDIYANYATVNGTAISGPDYTAMAGTAMIARGTAVVQVVVPVVRDSNEESDETMIFRLSNAINASIFKADALGAIVADDGLVVSIGDKSLTEGTTGTSPMVFTATLNQSPTVPVTVNWSTVEGSAIAPDDYVTANGQIAFDVGETTKTITVQVVGDAVAEPYETFTVVLSTPGGAILGDAEGTGTIVNTDGTSDRFRLMFHNLADNHLYRWHFKKEVVGSPSLETFNWVTPFGPDPDWKIGTIADFDRDGNLDYLWHNYTTGTMLFWYIDGDNLKGFKFQNYTMASPWRVATTMDANGDGELDVVYYNDQTGVLKVVLCENGNRLSDYDVTTFLLPSVSWRVTTASDVNGDGADDLILYNSATGGLEAWLLTGPTRSGTLAYAAAQTTPDQFRLVSARADFNADGKPDFLWHNTTTGFFMTWLMDGTARLGTGTFASPFDRTDPTWRLVGAATLWP